MNTGVEQNLCWACSERDGLLIMTTTEADILRIAPTPDYLVRKIEIPRPRLRR